MLILKIILKKIILNLKPGTSLSIKYCIVH